MASLQPKHIITDGEHDSVGACITDSIWVNYEICFHSLIILFSCLCELMLTVGQLLKPHPTSAGKEFTSELVVLNSRSDE